MNQETINVLMFEAQKGDTPAMILLARLSAWQRVSAFSGKTEDDTATQDMAVQAIQGVLGNQRAFDERAKERMADIWAQYGNPFAVMSGLYNIE